VVGEEEADEQASPLAHALVIDQNRKPASKKEDKQEQKKGMARVGEILSCLGCVALRARLSLLLPGEARSFLLPAAHLLALVYHVHHPTHLTLTGTTAQARQGGRRDAPGSLAAVEPSPFLPSSPSLSSSSRDPAFHNNGLHPLEPVQVGLALDQRRGCLAPQALPPKMYVCLVEGGITLSLPCPPSLPSSPPFLQIPRDRHVPRTSQDTCLMETILFAIEPLRGCGCLAILSAVPPCLRPYPLSSLSHHPSPIIPPLPYSNPTDGLDVAESSDATSIKTQMIGLLNAIQYLKGT